MQKRKKCKKIKLPKPRRLAPKVFDKIRSLILGPIFFGFYWGDKLFMHIDRLGRLNKKRG